MNLLIFNLAVDADDSVLGFTTEWINEFARRAEHVFVITMRAGRIEVADNVSVFSVGKEKGYSEPRRAVEFYRILFRLLREERIGGCFAHMMPLFAIMGAPLLRWKGVPVVLWYAHKSVTWTLRLAEKAVNRVVTASPESFRLKSDKVIVTGHGINTERFTPSSAFHESHPFTITSIGRVAPIKRLEELIYAACLLVEEQSAPEFQIRIVGEAYPKDQSYADSLRRQVENHGLQSYVNFTGGVPFEQVVSEYQRADVAVNLSDTGSVDKSVLEAMSCALPVVTSNVAFESMLSDWSDLFLVSEEVPIGLAHSLRKLVNMSDDERREKGQALREIVVARHSLHQLACQIMDVFGGWHSDRRK